MSIYDVAILTLSTMFCYFLYTVYANDLHLFGLAVFCSFKTYALFLKPYLEFLYRMGGAKLLQAENVNVLVFVTSQRPNLKYPFFLKGFYDMKSYKDIYRDIYRTLFTSKQ